MDGRRWWIVAMFSLACVGDEPAPDDFRAFGSSAPSETLGPSAFDLGSEESGDSYDDGPTPDCGDNAKSYKDAEDPIDVFTLGCVGEFDDASCGNRVNVHPDRCYENNGGSWRPQELKETYAFDTEMCGKDTCCPKSGETVVDCWAKCQVESKAPRSGWCEEYTICKAGPQFGCVPGKCFGSEPIAGRCACKESSFAKDSDGFDPATRGCATKYADAGCGGTTTYVTDTCDATLVDYLSGMTEVVTRTDDVGGTQAANTCGTLWMEHVDCEEWCKKAKHKGGACQNGQINCGGQMVNAGKCVCTD